MISLTFVLAAASLSPLNIRGNQVVDDHGKPVRLRGVNTAAMEWSSDGERHILQTVRVATRDWHSNVIRLPLSQDRWFGKAPEQRDKGAAYRVLVKQVVQLAAANGAYVMLDLHWNNAGVWGQNIGQHLMPDMNSVTFWKDCARTFLNNPAVIFDLYNEPHDITWDVWRDGGEVTESRPAGARNGPFIPRTYRTPGMQALLNTVRATGARNLVVVGGLDWSYDLSGFMKGYALRDPTGRGVLYACHAYPFKGDTVEKWLTKIDAALPHLPVIVSEFGSDTKPGEADKPNPWVVQVVDAMEKRKMNWTAWDMHPAASPILIKDWNYTPTPHFGEVIKAALAAR
jgi:hypothetical protein